MFKNKQSKKFIFAIAFLSFFLLPANSILAQSNDEIKSAIDKMSLDEILVYVSSLEDNVTSVPFGTLTKRLYEIAYFDHHIPTEKREAAVQLLGSVKQDVKESFKDHPDLLNAYQAANQFMEDNIIKFGYGSLAWLSEENQIKAKDIIGYVMKPEHGHLLSEYLKIMREGSGGTLRKIKPYLIKNLIILRHHFPGGMENAVLEVFGLVTKKDPAAFAIFSDDELKTILRTPKNYQEARNILVKYGLLPKLSQSGPFTPMRKDEFLTTIIMLSSHFKEGAGKYNFWKQNPEIKDFYENLENENEKPSLRVYLMAQRILLWLDLIKDIYGEAVYERIKNIVFAQLKNIMELGFNDLFKAIKTAEISYNPEMDASFDVLTTYSLMFVGGLIKDSNKLSEENERLLQGYANILNRDRVESLDVFRFYLRFFASPPSIDIEEIDDEIWNKLMERYVSKGAFVGGIEKSLYMEDWIGVDVLN